MEAQVFEGTFADIRQQLLALKLNPDTRLRIIVTEQETHADITQEFLATSKRRNGLILVPQ